MGLLAICHVIFVTITEKMYIFSAQHFAAQRQALIEGLAALLVTDVMHSKKNLYGIFYYTAQIIFMKLYILTYLLFYKRT